MVRILIISLLSIFTSVVLSSAVDDDCPVGCLCMPINWRKENWMLNYTLNRWESLLISKGRHSQRIKYSTDLNARQMICTGLNKIPNEIPLDIEKVNIYGSEQQSIDRRSRHRSRNHLEDLDIQDLIVLSHLLELSIEGNNLSALPEGMFLNMRRLKHLSLRENHLKMFPPNVFRGLMVVELIDLSKNELAFLSPFCTFDFLHLKYMYLDHNFIEELTANDFIKFVVLKELDLSHNIIEYFDETAFHPLVYLKRLNLAANRLTDVKRIWFERNEPLEWLNLANNQITMIEGMSFSNLKDLKYLDLSGNKLGALDGRMFAGLQSLTHLDVSNNQVTILDPNAFSFLRELIDLNLSNNMIRFLDGNTFHQLGGLAHLSLNNNSIDFLDNQILKSMPNLAVLSLSHNHLKSIHVGMFQNLSELRELRLDNNKIRHIEDGSFSVSSVSNLSKLGWIFLDSNHLRHVSSGTFAGTPFLRHLGLSKNNINSIHGKAFQFCKNLISLNLEVNQLEDIAVDLFKQQTALKKLNVQGNRIKELKMGSLNGLYSLIDLHLENNSIRKIDSSTFQQLYQLRQLNLSGNHLEWIDLNILTDMFRLKYLDLSYNHLQDIVPMQDNYYKNLKVLSLAYNQIRTLEESITEIFEYGGTIHLKENPWRCACELSWMPEINTIFPHLFANPDDVRCNKPLAFAGKQVLNLAQEDFCEIPNFLFTTQGLFREETTLSTNQVTAAPVTNRRASDATTAFQTERTTTKSATTANKDLENNNRRTDFEFNVDTMPLVPKFMCDQMGGGEVNTRAGYLLSGWHASIVKKESTALCSGVQLNQEWLIMAASCVQGSIDVKNLDNYTVALGTKETFGQKMKKANLKRIYIHPEYRKAGAVNDVALVYTSPLNPRYASGDHYPCIMSKNDLESAIKYFHLGRISASKLNSTATIKVDVKKNKLSPTMCSNNKYICSSLRDMSADTHNLIGAPVYVKYGVRDNKWGLAGLNTARTRFTRSGKTVIHKHLPLYAYVNWFEHIIEQEARWLTNRYKV